MTYMHESACYPSYNVCVVAVRDTIIHKEHITCCKLIVTDLRCCLRTRLSVLLSLGTYLDMTKLHLSLQPIGQVPSISLKLKFSRAITFYLKFKLPFKYGNSLNVICNGHANFISQYRSATGSALYSFYSHSDLLHALLLSANYCSLC